jgi:cyclopropane-fatty-acyl-phospholipid synthase
MRLGIQFLAKIQIGSVDLILPDNRKLHFKGKQAGPHGILIVHNERMAKRFIWKGKLGFHESYLDGDWDSPDMTTFFTLILQNEEYFKKTMNGRTWLRALEWVGHALQPNTKTGSRKNIYHHYDIGNDFYSAWLDPSMTYSSALFSNENDDLETAQNRKYQEMAARMGIEPHHHVLEIGCGWGGFAEYVATHIGARVTAVTISNAQFDYATSRIERAGLAHKVTIHLQDYRDIRGQFDSIGSIEMFEAVGESWWPTYFSQIKNLLKPKGRAVLQIITINERDFESYRRTADYIQKYIFPGGMLPSLSALEKVVSAAKLSMGDILSFGPDYERTLKLWNEKFQSAWPKLRSEKLDPRFKRLWEQYFCYCEAGFRTKTIDVIQLTLHN